MRVRCRDFLELLLLLFDGGDGNERLSQRSLVYSETELGKKFIREKRELFG